DLRLAVRERCRDAPCRWSLLVADDGVRAAGNPDRRGLDRRATQLGLLVSRPAAKAVSRIVSAVRAGAGDQRRRAEPTARLEHHRPPGLHRDDPPMAPALRAAKLAQVADEAAPGAALADQRGLSPRVHLGRELQQHLLRARVARALSAGVRKARLARNASGTDPELEPPRIECRKAPILSS